MAPGACIRIEQSRRLDGSFPLLPFCSRIVAEPKNRTRMRNLIEPDEVGNSDGSIIPFTASAGESEHSNPNPTIPGNTSFEVYFRKAT